MEILLVPFLVGIIFVSSATSQGTTPDIEDIFIGRCSEYKNILINPLLESVDVDCKELWDEFSEAFIYQPKCSDTEEDYIPFLVKASQQLPRDKLLFWSGTMDLASRYARFGHRYVTMESTLIGYLANNLMWCGIKEQPGMDYHSCPSWGSCHGGAGTKSFWGAASKMFANGAEGTIRVMLSGSDPQRPAYRIESTFASVELPNLNVSKVEKVHVLLTHEIGKPHVETCDSGSLLQLREDVLDRGMEFFCEDDPESVMFVQCSDEPDSLECQEFSAEAAGELCNP